LVSTLSSNVSKECIVNKSISSLIASNDSTTEKRVKFTMASVGVISLLLLLLHALQRTDHKLNISMKIFRGRNTLSVEFSLEIRYSPFINNSELHTSGLVSDKQ